MEIAEIAKKIKYVVVLMMENRSFDHLFGYYPGIVGTPWGLNKPDSPQYYNLADPAVQTSAQFPTWPVNISGQITLNPNHSFSGMMTDTFGPSTQGCLDGQASPTPPTYYPSQTMCGFYSTNPTAETNGQAPVMAAFEYGSLKVLHRLADHFVLCANWYCDTPSETVPNRHFVHAATNMGWNDSNPKWPVRPGKIPMGEASDIYQAKTLYENLDNIAGSGIHWTMYGFRGFGTENQESCSYDSDMYAYTNSTVISGASDPYAQGHRNIGDFENDIDNGRLPFYTFINPSLNYPGHGNGNSMHPVSDIQYGENYVAHVYNILRTSNIWNETLLVVTFDENGGLYDHILPPTTVSPDGITFPPNVCNPLFDYSRLGPRVSTLLISPWLQRTGEAGNLIDLTQYQNTSIPRFAQDLFNAIQANQAPAPYLTERDRTAPSFANSEFWRDKLPCEPAPEVEVYPGYHWYYPLQTEPGCEGGAWPIPGADDAPTQDAVDLVLQYVTHLPGHADSGNAVARTFATCGLLWAYLQERNQAARVDGK